MHELCEFLYNELRKLEKRVANNNDLSPTEVEYGDKVAHFYKTLKVTEAMEDGDYSNASYDDGMSMARGYSRDGGGASYARGRNARRDSRGRYSRENRGRNRGYSREGENEEMIQELRELMNETSDMQTRQAFNNFIEKLESM